MHLKEETQRNIERVVGLPIERIRELTLDEEIAYVENRTGRKLQFPKGTDWRFVATGNPLINMGRCRTMEDVDIKFDKMFPFHSMLWKIKRFMRGEASC